MDLIRGDLGQAALIDMAVVLAPITLGLTTVALGVDPAWVWPWVLLPPLLRYPWLLIRLALLIQRRHRLAPPFPLGLWGEVYRGIARYQQRGRRVAGVRSASADAFARRPMPFPMPWSSSTNTIASNGPIRRPPS
jgi:hypothetical protein